MMKSDPFQALVAGNAGCTSIYPLISMHVRKSSITDFCWGMLNMENVWYAAYGSNLLRERFMCYINGGRFRLGGRDNPGCSDRTPPMDDRPYGIPYRMYFAQSSRYWEYGGVAFLDASRKLNGGSSTPGRIWKITEEQYECIHSQEGSFYGREVDLGFHEDGNRVLTFTAAGPAAPAKPSGRYVRTVSLGLKETYGMHDDDVADYLGKIEGIIGKYTETELRRAVKFGFRNSSE